MQEDITIVEFLGTVYYHESSQSIYRKKDNQLILNVRSWGNIQYLFKNEDGSLNTEKAVNFQDDLGEFITDAINSYVNGISEAFEKLKNYK